MTHTHTHTSTEPERQEFEQMRVAFERAFGPMPKDCTWTGFGYCSSRHNNWRVDSYADKFRGFIAGQSARRAPAVPPITGDYEPAPMTAGRASYFMERFLKEEKLLGPNEQAALHYVIAMLSAAPQPPEAECMTCSSHGAVGNIENAEPCPECTPRSHFAESAPVQLPEPVSAESRFTSFSGDRWRWCTVEHARAFGQDKGYEVRYLYTEQQVRQILSTLQK